MARVWEELSRTLRGSAPYERLRQALGDVERLPVPAAAWVAGLLGQDLERPLLVLVPREADALRWVEAAELFLGQGSARFFPAPSLTPYQEAETSLLVRAQEAVAVDALVGGSVGAGAAVVATPRALFRRLPSPEVFRRRVLEVRPGEEHPLEELSAHLIDAGYHRSDLVMEVGEFAVRGGIFDVFPPGRQRPVRLDLFGDTVESLRAFDPESQRSEDQLDETRLLPLLLFPGGPEAAQDLGVHLVERLGLGLEDFDHEAPADGEGSSGEVAEKLRLLRDLGRFPGWENLLPLMAGETMALSELTRGALTVAVDPESLLTEARHHADVLASEYEARQQPGRLALPPEELEHPLSRVEDALGAAEVRLLDLAFAGASGDGSRPVDFEATTTELFHGQLPRFPPEVETAHSRGDRVVLVAVQEHRRRLVDLLEGRGLELDRADAERGVEIAEGELQRGFRLPAASLSLYSERQLFSRTAPAPVRKKPRFGPFISSLRDLKIGDYVVHSEHGIGQFVALRNLAMDTSPSGPLPPSLEGLDSTDAGGVEVMEISYSGGRTLLLPLSRLDQVQKYSGIESVAPKLDKLGGSSWQRTKARVKKGLKDMAGELVKLYAARQLARAPAMPADSDLLHQFEAAFEYDETPDQEGAIAAIKKDLQDERPMDRLLCGDVGYGKTEVAMRAAFKVVDGGYQVAVLAPTTILADQHLSTFRRRFAGFPVTVEMVSRFRSAKEVKDIAQRLEQGRVDILIGTHRLLNKSLKFKNLGLLIIDEEQRFGVAQKERLKQFKKNIHVLAMSATPVPRTLQMSLAGVRDLAVIETPPKDRMAVETAIVPFTSELVKEAVEFELERGGQVYFVYNRVENIEQMQTYLRKTVPRARVTVGHGQLDERELARRMHAFTEGEFDVLLATTIIENGIDIPNVNTMIVYRADRFGLAQLYQLRGRVGRSSQLAYCYLLVPADQVLSEVARKRLSAIREFTDLGAGFRIAARDLEIRGAGNLLGAEQSGHIMAVGIETYLRMLEDTVRELKGEEVEESVSTTLDLPAALAVPESYVEDANLRMEIYRMVAAAEQSEEALLAELEDRFGRPPKPVENLVVAGHLKRRSEALRIQGISGRRGTLTLRMRQDARVDLDALFQLVEARPGAAFSPSGVLTVPVPEGSSVLALATDVVGELHGASFPPPPPAAEAGARAVLAAGGSP